MERLTSISKKKLRQMQYYRTKLRCEKLDLKVAQLDEDSFGKRVQLNLLDVFPIRHHPQKASMFLFKLMEEHFVPLELPKVKEYWWVDQPETLDEMCSILLDKSTISVDSELDSVYSFHPIIALIQISCDTFDFLVDAIALHSMIKDKLSPIFMSKTILKLVYGHTDFDFFKRDFELFFLNVLDVQQVHKQITSSENVIAFNECVDLYLKKKISKENQTFFFRLRELLADVIKYAIDDTKLLLEV